MILLLRLVDGMKFHFKGMSVHLVMTCGWEHIQSLDRKNADVQREELFTIILRLYILTLL